MRGIPTNVAALAVITAGAIRSNALADEPMFAVIRPDAVLVAQRVVVDDERVSPRSMSDRGWSTRTNSRSGGDDKARSTTPLSNSSRSLARPNASAGSKRASAAQSATGNRARKSSAFDSSAAPLRRDLPKVLRDPPPTRRRPLGW